MNWREELKAYITKHYKSLRKFCKMASIEPPTLWRVLNQGLEPSTETAVKIEAATKGLFAVDEMKGITLARMKIAQGG